MKKIISIFLAVILTFSLFCISSFAKDTYDNTSKKIESTLINFYRNKDLGEKNDLSPYVTTDVLQFLNNKIETYNYVDKLYGFNIENYELSVNLIEKDVNKTKQLLKYNIVASYNYTNSPDIDSRVSELVYIVYDTVANKIVDFYTPGNYYDDAVINSDETNLEKSVITEFKVTETIKTNHSSLIEDINNIYETQTKIPASSSRISNNTRGVGLNLTNVKNYALNNCDKTTPDQGNSSVPYVDFSQQGGYDCTNFVSHALIAGGAKTYYPGGSGISSTGWFFKSMQNRSSSWSSVNHLYNFLVNNSVSNTAAGIADNYVTYDGYWTTGSVIQIKESESANYSHSMIITGKNVSVNRAYAYATGRTADNWYNYNEPVERMYPNVTKRVIYVYNLD